MFHKTRGSCNSNREVTTTGGLGKKENIEVRTLKIPHPDTVRSPPQVKSTSKTVPPVPISAQNMKKTAHTSGSLLKFEKRKWICCWCARYYSNFMFYDNDNSSYPCNSIKLTGADIVTDYQNNMYRILITPAKLDKDLPWAHKISPNLRNGLIVFQR